MSDISTKLGNGKPFKQSDGVSCTLFLLLFNAASHIIDKTAFENASCVEYSRCFCWPRPSSSVGIEIVSPAALSVLAPASYIQYFYVQIHYSQLQIVLHPLYIGCDLWTPGLIPLFSLPKPRRIMSEGRSNIIGRRWQHQQSRKGASSMLIENAVVMLPSSALYSLWAPVMMAQV